MFRDKFKNKDYFIKRLEFNSEVFYDFEEMVSEIQDNRMSRFYLIQSGYSEKLLTINYSLGHSLDEVFKWFKISLNYYQKYYQTKGGIYTLIDYLSLAVLFEDRKEEFIEDVEKIFSKYQSFVDSGEQYEDSYIDTLAL